MKRATVLFLAVLVVGCATHLGGIDTFAALPAASALATPDEAEVALYALVVKIVAPARDLVKSEHAAGRISDARYVELRVEAQKVGLAAEQAMTAIGAWRDGATREPFDTRYAAAVSAASEFLNAPEVRR